MNRYFALGLGFAVALMATMPADLHAERRTYVARYNDGGSGYNWLSGQWKRSDSGTGYTGNHGGINTPHRSNWYAKLNAQRRWDEEQYRKQMAANRGAECGFTTSPAYCYRLMRPYPAEYRIVRY